MSREVEVQNIKLTATVPEDIQISLGHLQYVAGGTNDVTTSTVSGHTGLAGNEGVLKRATSGEGDTADDGNVQAPNAGTDDISMLDWASTADISAYYQLGKIMPASSTDGKCILFTPDADGVGKSLKTGAEYYYAVGSNEENPDILNPVTDSTVANDSKGIVANYRTKLHATTRDDTWSTNYTTASAWNVTNHDGYYVDIPVWLRTSSTDGANLAVDAYVTTNAAKDDDDLYLAARAVILYDNTASATKAGATPNSTSKLIEVKKDKWSSLESIVDFMTTTNATGEAVASATEVNVGTYGTQTHYNGGKFVQLPKSDGTGAYGAASKVIIRVWLEGEDPNCWNQNAGQNFNICLKFTKDALVQNTGSVTEPSENANYPKANTFGAETSGTLPVKAGDTVTVNETVGSSTFVLKYTVQKVVGGDPTWVQTDGTYYVASAGKKHQISGTDLATDDTLGVIAWLNANAKTKESIANVISVTEADVAAAPAEPEP